MSSSISHKHNKSGKDYLVVLDRSDQQIDEVIAWIQARAVAEDCPHRTTPCLVLPDTKGRAYATDPNGGKVEVTGYHAVALRK